MWESLLRILALARKELVSVLSDRRSRSSLLIPTIVQGITFGYAASYDLDRVPYVLVDEDRTAASRAFTAKLEGAGVFRRVADTASVEQARRLVDERRALLVVRIGRQFEEKLVLGRPVDVLVAADGRNSNTATTAVGYAGAIVDRFNDAWRSERARPPSGVGRDRGVWAEGRAWYNPNLETRWSMIPGLMGTLTMFQTLLLTAMSFTREREQGTLDQLRMTPFRPLEIAIGKAAPAILIGFAQVTNVLVVARLWFDVPFVGSLATLYAGLGLFLSCCVGLGLLTAAVSPTMQKATLYSFISVMPLALLSGLLTPIENMPEPLQRLTLLNPLRHGVELAQRVFLEGAGAHALRFDVLALALLAALSLAGGFWAFRRT
jgi:ABC-2 type transport system permease protein